MPGGASVSCHFINHNHPHLTHTETETLADLPKVTQPRTGQDQPQPACAGHPTLHPLGSNYRKVILKFMCSSLFRSPTPYPHEPSRGHYGAASGHYCPLFHRVVSQKVRMKLGSGTSSMVVLTVPTHTPEVGTAQGSF